VTRDSVPRSSMQYCNRQAFASPFFPLSPAPSSTLDSIQCHSISQCNAHAAAYRRVSSVKRPLFPAALSVPRVTGASIKDSRARIWHVGEPLLYTDFIFQLHFVAYSWTSPPSADFVFKTVVRRRDSTIAAFDYHTYNRYY